MKWITFQGAAGDQVGVVSDGGVYVVDDERTLLDLITSGAETMRTIGASALDGEPIHPMGEVELCSPVAPNCVRDFLSFLDHYRNATLNPDLAEIWNKQPAFYFSNPWATAGPADPIHISPGSAMFDFELEVAAVIGTGGHHLHPDEAEAHIAGYMIFCDWSARDLQLAEMETGLGPVKGKDSANTFGPMFVTSDELEPHRSKKGFDLGMRAWVNDRQVTSGSLSQLDWSFGEMIAYASRGTHVRAGDVIGSGTVPMGCLLEHAMKDGDDFAGFLEPGDRLRLEVDLLGELDLCVTDPLPAHPIRASSQN